MLTLQRLMKHSLSRKVEKPRASFDDIVEYKWRRFSRYSQKYESPEQFKHEDKFYQQFVYGHSCHIAATTQHSFQSQKFSKSVMKYVQPNLLILGGLSDNFLRFNQQIFNIRQRYDHPTYKPEKMMCSERISSIIQTRLEQDQDFFWDDRKMEMTTLNHKDKRIMPVDYLTVAHMAALQGGTKIILGKPSDTLVFQDIIMRYSVKELADMVQRAVETVKKNQCNDTLWRESFSLQAIQNYMMSEEPSIYSRQLTYQTALLKRFAKIEDKILLLTPGYFVHRIAEQVHHIDINPENVFRNGINETNSESYHLLQKTLEANPEEILEKFALICLLKQNWIQAEFEEGTNVFMHMAFGKLFENDDIQDLQNRYILAKERVSTKWYQLMKHRINNIHLVPQPYSRISLNQQFRVLDERSSKSFPYTYEQKNYLSEYEDKVKLAKLEARMMDMLNEEGDKHNIQIFEALLKGKRSREGIILYSKLIGKANIESQDRLKLPIFHFGAFRGIYKEYMRDFILKADYNTKIQQRMKKRISKIEKATQALMKQLQNPYELNNFLTGKKGKVFHFNMDMNEGPQLTAQTLEELKKLMGEVSQEQQKELAEQYGEDWNSPQPEK